MYKFLRDSIFVDDQNLVYFQGSFAINHCATYMHFKIFKDFIFAADKLPAKTVKLRPSKISAHTVSLVHCNHIMVSIDIALY